MSPLPARPVPRHAAACALAFAAALSGCGDRSQAAAGARRGDSAVGSVARDTVTGAPVAAPAAAGGPLGDAAIVVLVRQANDAEFAAAQLAAPKLQDLDARAFAAAMASEHLALNAALDSVGLEADTLARPPAQFASLRRVADTAATRLVRTPSGPAFDAAYLASQVAAHARTADSLARWQSAARSPALRAALAAALPRVQAHLARARALAGAPRPAGGPVPPPAPDTGGATRVQRATGPALGVRWPEPSLSPARDRATADTLRPYADTAGRRSGAAFSRADSARARRDSARAGADTLRRPPR